MTLSDRDEKIVNNLSLVHYLINAKYPEYRFDEDVFQTGVVGLVIAADTFDSKRGIAFSTYASKCILNEIGSSFRKTNKYAKDVSLETVRNVHDDSCDIDYFDLRPLLDRLTMRERMILELLVSGYSQSDIARMTGRVKQLVQKDVVRIREKYNEVYG